MDSVTRNETVQLTRQDLQDLFDVLRDVGNARPRMHDRTALDLINQEHYKLEQLLLGLQKRFE
jgi:hypothetical protein